MDKGERRGLVSIHPENMFCVHISHGKACRILLGSGKKCNHQGLGWSRPRETKLAHSITGEMDFHGHGSHGSLPTDLVSPAV